MHLKINPAPPMKKMNFSCDEEITPKIECIIHLRRDFLNMYNTTALIGTQGSGKPVSPLIFYCHFIKNAFHYIYVFMPETSRNSLKNNIFDKYLPKYQIYEELNEQTIDELYEKLKDNSAMDIISH